MKVPNNPSHSGIVTSGKFIPDDKDFFKYDVSSFEGLRVSVSIKESKRPDVYNRYYWAAIVKTFTDFFNQEKTFGRVVKKEFVHEILTAKFLGFTNQTLPGGEVIMMRTPSRDLTKREFYDYVTYCKSWGEEYLNLTFPENKEQ